MTDFALVQSHPIRSATAAAAFDLVLPKVPTQGNKIILTVCSDSTVATPLGYVIDSDAIANTGTYIFSRDVGAAESATIHIVLVVPANISARAWEWSGLTAGGADKQASATPGNGTTQSSGSTGTLSQADEFCVALLGFNYGGNYPTFDNGFAAEGAIFGLGTDQPANATAFKRVTSTAAQSVTATMPSSISGASICLAAYKIAAGVTTFTGKPANYVDALAHFETSSAGTVITDAILANSWSGAFSDKWITISDPDAQTPGAVPALTIETGATHAQDKDILVEGVAFPRAGSGTRGMRATQSANNCIQLRAGQAAEISLGMHWSYSGAAIDNSPRDFIAMRSDDSGNYQFAQCTDGSSPTLHVHGQPNSGTGIGDEIPIVKGHKYWLQFTHVPGGGTNVLSLYDAENEYALVGTSSLTISGAERIGSTTIQIGCIKYSAGATQWMDFDNIELSLDSRTPPTPAPAPAPPPPAPPARLKIYSGPF